MTDHPHMVSLTLDDVTTPVEGDRASLSFVQIISKGLAAKKGQLRSDEDLKSFYYMVNNHNYRDLAIPVQTFTFDKTFDDACSKISGSSEVCTLELYDEFGSPWGGNRSQHSSNNTYKCFIQIDGQQVSAASYTVNRPGDSYDITIAERHHPQEYHISFESNQYGKAISRELSSRLGLSTEKYDVNDEGINEGYSSDYFNDEYESIDDVIESCSPSLTFP